MTTPERRGAPRASSRLSVILHDEANEIQAWTENISASGAYCTLSRFFEPMTKLHVRLEIPLAPKPREIECHGVVVRVEPPEPSPRHSRYRIAIFFNELTERDRSTLARFVQQRLHSLTAAR